MFSWNWFLSQTPYSLRLYQIWNRSERGQDTMRFIRLMLQRNAHRALGVFGRVDVEERVDRLSRPIGDRDAVPCRPDLDLAQALVDQGLAQALAQRQRP